MNYKSAIWLPETFPRWPALNAINPPRELRRILDIPHSPPPHELATGLLPPGWLHALASALVAL